MDDLGVHYEVDVQPLSGTHRVHGGRRSADGHAVVVKGLVEEYPTSTEIAALRHEFSLLNRLRNAPVARPLGLFRRGNGVVLVLEKVPGQSLDRILQAERPEPLRFCQLSLWATRALEAIHAEGVVHRDIKPSHFFVDEAAGRALIIDFSLATELSREHHAPMQAGRLLGTLAYISPEQTGRLNRSVDRRADLYSLGVTLYELATGKLPFSGDDALELVHAHIARSPTALRELRPDLPEALSDIVMRLLEKLPDERYQTAHGLRVDLERVQDALLGSGPVAPFALGKDDYDAVLRLPEKLYGRDAQARTLMSSFRVARDGGCRLLLISGPAGVGKSALVHELHRELVSAGQFASGKFDQYNRSVPYSALTKACGELVRAYLASPLGMLEAWKERLVGALSDNVSVVMEVVPELVLALGERPPAAPLPPVEAQVRFERSFRHFMQASACEDSPLVLFLDDLQWADSASLAVLEAVLSSAEQSHLLVIGNHRDAEVDARHPLAKCLERLDGRVAIERIELGPLSDTDVEQLVSDALPLRAEPVEPLARCIASKTSGNPFFVAQFLQRLHAEGHLRFETGRGYYWDSDAIAGLDVTDNVVDLVLSRLGRLEEGTQRLLELAACIGHDFDLSTLAVIAENSPAEVARALRPALSDGFVLPAGIRHRTLDDALLDDGTAEAQVRYRFAHDRVQQAAVAGIAEGERSRVHARVGRRLLECSGPGGLSDERLFEVVGHLNLGRRHLDGQDERLQVARLNLRAAGRAKSAAAYSSALELASACLEFLGDDPWEADHGTCHAAQLIAAECHYLQSDNERALATIDLVEAKAQSLLERVPARNLKAALLSNQGRAEAASGLSLETMALLGLELPDPRDQAALQQAIGPAFGAFQQILGGREVASLRDLPSMTDPKRLALLATIAGIMPAVFQSNQNLMVLIVLRAIPLVLESGQAPLSPFLYGLYGVVHGAITNDHARAYEFAKLALELCRHPEYAASRGGVRFLCGALLSPWVRPLRESASHFERGSVEALDAGDRMHANFCTATIPSARLCAGAPLTEVTRATPGDLAALQASGDVTNVGLLRVVEQTAACLRGETASFGSFDAEDFSEAEVARQGTPPVRALYGTCKLMVRYLAGDAEEALRISEEFPPLPGLVYATDYVFYRAMACADLAREAEPERRRELLEQLEQSVSSFAPWAEACSENFGARHQLLRAERRALSDEPALAIDDFERAIELAAAGSALHQLALAFERTGRFHYREGRLRLAGTCLRDACYHYERWGATRKLQQLAEEFPEAARGERAKPAHALTSSTTLTGGSETGSAEWGQLDLASAMRATEAMASELRLEPLLRRLMDIVVENAGATRGALVLPGGEELRVRASLTLEPKSVEAGLDEPVHQTKRLAASIVQYCARSAEAVVLDNAARMGRFVSDPYVSERMSRSIVCLPLTLHGKLVGVLYLENEAVTGAFHERRVERLKFLGGHAAASLENARLYDQLRAANESLEQRVIERTAELSARNADMRRVLDNVVQGLVTIDLEGRLASEHSAVIDEWFGRFEGGTDFREYLAAIDERFAETFSVTFELLLDGFLLSEVAIGQMPSALDHGGRHYSFGYEPIQAGGALTGLLIIIDDRTEALQRAREEAEQKEELALCRQLTRNRESLLRFFEEADDIVAGILTDSVSFSTRRALLHTLKGNAAMFDFAQLARLCHDVENAIELDHPTVQLVALVGERWNALKATLRLLAGEDAWERVEVSRTTLAELVKRIEQGLAAREIVDELERLQLEPLSRPLTRLGDYARRLADKLGKGELQVSVRDGNCHADGACAAPLWAALVHLVRNAVDHGLERADQREARGKPRSGLLELEARCSGGDLLVEVRDDGRGIDWERVRTRAVERGLPSRDRDDLVKALFASKLSTRDDVSETSGRGVGLNAVLLEVERLGGRIDVDSEVGAGCRFVVQIQASALGVRGPTANGTPRTSHPPTPNGQEQTV